MHAHYSQYHVKQSFLPVMSAIGHASKQDGMNYGAERSAL